MSISSIHTNIAAQAASFHLSRSTSEAANSAARLASGDRIFRAADDVAAMSTGAALAGHLAGMRSGLTNSSLGSSMMQVAAGGISEILNILEEQKGLAVQAQSGALTAAERAVLDLEFQELSDEINQIASGTNFGQINLLNGGLGSNFTQFTTNALSAAFDPSGADINTGFSDASTVSIQAFDKTDGTSRHGVGTAGFLQMVDGADTVLANQAFLSVGSNIYGQFSSFTIGDVTYGVSGTLTAMLNGVEYSGTFAHNATAVTISNGSNRIRLGTTALNLTNDATTALAQSQLGSDFADTIIMRAGSVGGVNFADTRLEDAVGTATSPAGSVRVAAPNASIGNFQYAGASGVDANVLTVEVNGETYTASGVTDSIDDGNGTMLVFEKGNGEALKIDITGLTGGTNTAITNIRTSLTDRQQFIDALNVGFSRSGGGLSFNVSGSAGNNISVSLDAANTSHLFGGQSLDLSSTGSATTAETAVDGAINIASAIQARIGSLQARFDFAGAATETAILGVDEARATLLDTDIAAESTYFATAQVRVQAGVAALAQANLLPSTLVEVLNFN